MFHVNTNFIFPLINEINETVDAEKDVFGHSMASVSPYP